MWPFSRQPAPIYTDGKLHVFIDFTLTLPGDDREVVISLAGYELNPTQQRAFRDQLAEAEASTGLITEVDHQIDNEYFVKLVAAYKLVGNVETTHIVNTLKTILRQELGVSAPHLVVNVTDAYRIDRCHVLTGIATLTRVNDWLRNAKAGSGALIDYTDRLGGIARTRQVTACIDHAGRMGLRPNFRADGTIDPSIHTPANQFTIETSGADGVISLGYVLP